MWEGETWENKILEKTALKVAESGRNRGRGVGINVGSIWNGWVCLYWCAESGCRAGKEILVVLWNREGDSGEVSGIYGRSVVSKKE